MVVPKPGKPDNSKVRAYQAISRLDVISKLVEHTAALLIVDHPGTKNDSGRMVASIVGGNGGLASMQ